MGGSEAADGADGSQAGAEADQGGSGQPSGGADKGFPENTPLTQMTEAQKVAYYQHQNRQSDNKLKAFNGFTPQDVSVMWSRLEELETANLGANEKAVKDATTKAATEAKTAAESALRPRLHEAQFRAIAGPVLKEKEALNAVMAITDPAKFLGDDGDVDEEKVMGHLTALSAVFTGGQGQGQPGNGQQPPAWGQNSGGAGSPPARPGEAGRAAIAKRHGVKTT